MSARSDVISSVSCQLSRSSGLTNTAAGRPLRVMTMRSSRLSTPSTSSLSFALTSESDRVFMGRPALLTSFLVRSYQPAGARRDSRTPLLPRLPAVERRQLGLLREVVGGAKVAVALNEQ